MALWMSSVCANEGLWSLGMKVQGAVDFAPGNDYLLGPEIGYSDLNLASHRLQFRICYLTSRLEQSARENILKQDEYLFSPVWHFRRVSFFDPTIQLDLGYARYDVENEEIFGSLDNDTWIAALQLGMGFNFSESRYGFSYSVGYNLINSESSIIYPLVFGVGVWVGL